MSISLFANNIQTTLASNITSTQTSITLVSTVGLPTPVTGQYFVMTFTNGTTNEVVWVTNVSGSTITCIRGQEGTVASSFTSGSFASCFPTSGTMQNLVQIDQLQNGAYSFSTAAGTANALTASIPSNLTLPLPNGFQFIVNSTAANTGAATLNLTLSPTIAGGSPTSTGALPIYQNGNSPLTGGEITGANYLCLMSYNSNYNGGSGAFVLENPYNAVVGVVGITQVQDQYFTYATATGTSDVITLTLPNGISSLADGTVATFKTTAANTTTTPTLNVTYGSTATGAKVIKKYNAQSLSVGDIGAAGYIAQVMYSSTASCWILMNPAPGVAGGVTSLTAGTGISVSSSSGAVTVGNTGVTQVNGSTGIVTITPASISAMALSGGNTITGTQALSSGQFTTSGISSGTFGYTATGSGYTSGLGSTSLQIAVSGVGLYLPGGNTISMFNPAGTASLLNDGSFQIGSANAYKPGGGSWTASSDSRLKDNVVPLTGALAKLLKLNPVSYSWKYNAKDEPNVGFIAQEIQTVMPNAVVVGEPSEDQAPFIDDDKLLSVGFQNDIFAYLVSAIQELNSNVTQLQNTINIQASYIAALQAKV